MNSNKKAVKKKKMQFMIPNAKLAFNMAQVLLIVPLKGLLPSNLSGPMVI